MTRAAERGGGPTAARRATLALLAATWSALGSCGGTAPEPEPLARPERLGVLRDLVLFLRSPRQGGPFFLDRFETTRADWARWPGAVRAAGGAEKAPVDALGGVQPQVGMDLHEARAFAHWRLGRLPRFDEWQHAATGGGLYRRPWGNAERASWANTQELGLGALALVGTFESGRQPGGPYDLIGNAGEWTETPDPRWLPTAQRQPGAQLDLLEDELLWRLGALARSPARHAWLRAPGSPWPLSFLVAVDRAHLPRLVASGWNRPASVANVYQSVFWVTSWYYEARFPGERSGVLGVRIATDPDTLVERLAEVEGPLSALEERAVRGFLAREDVRRVMREASLRHQELVAPPESALDVLRRELGV